MISSKILNSVQQNFDRIIMDRSSSKKSSLFYTKRKREMEELERMSNEALASIDLTAPNIPWPDLGEVSSTAALENIPRPSVNLLEEEIVDHPEDIDVDEDDIEGDLSFVNHLSLNDALRHVAIVCRLSRFAVRSILAILRKHFHAPLPKSAQTFLKTPNTVVRAVNPIEGGHLWYRGIEAVLNNYYENVMPDVTKLSIDVSIDGLPLFKKSRKHLIPIQIRVVELPKSPVLVVGTFGGSFKPGSLEDFLRPFITEANELHQRGLRLGDRTMPFLLRAFIADAPMRAYLKATVNFNGKHGCLLCTTVGRSVQSGRGKTVIFETVNAPLRTDAGFRCGEYEGHHTGRTPLEEITHLDMIKGFPVGDRLHLIDEGVTKKILDGMLGNRFDKRQFIHWGSRQKGVVSAFLMKTRLPAEIPRPMRSLSEVASWKATEFRVFLHYISVVVFKDFMLQTAYNHFLLYFYGITILSTNEHKVHWPIAKRMLDRFVQDFAKHYGASYLSSNVHNLQHVTDEVERLGPLDTFSAYAFENNMRFIKPCVRSGTKIVQQVAGRLTEQSRVLKARHHHVQKYPSIKKKGRLLVAENFLLEPEFQNCWFLTTNNEIVKYVTVKKTASLSLIVVGIRVCCCEEFFKVSIPDSEEAGGLVLSSTMLHIYKIKLSALTSRVQVSPSSIKCKLVPIFIPSRPLCQLPVQRSPQPDSLILSPLLHTFQLSNPTTEER